MTRIKATALKQLFSTLFKNAVQNNTQVQFYKQVEDLTENRDILNKYTISLFLEI